VRGPGRMSGPLLLYKLPVMNELRRFLLESHMAPAFMRTVFNSLPLFEATNINKNFLLQVAGSPEALKTAKDVVNGAWVRANMGDVVRGNSLQKLLNFLYLMELREPGFTSSEVISMLHDLAIHNSLEQRFLSRVNSDTKPDDAMHILGDARDMAERAAKPYPNLTAEEERIWNRVKVYHEFPDGFKWVYAVDNNGKIVGFIPSEITSKTMNHCGNAPSNQEGNEYWELRGPDNKAYLTVILNEDGEIEESKSWGNQVNKYRVMILPYVKWFLKDQKVTGVGHRYNYGYAVHRNFGVKDFIGDDPEFVDYVLENKPALLGNAEERILFWKNALDEGVITVDDIKRIYSEQYTISDFEEQMPALKKYAANSKFKLNPEAIRREESSDSPFGANSFTVLCAACSGNPFTAEEIYDLVKRKILKLEEFANYNVHYLTPDMQIAFVQADPKNLDTLRKIQDQVATFTITPAIWKAKMPTEKMAKVEKYNNVGDILNMIASANPPSKMEESAKEVFDNEEFMRLLGEISAITSYEWHKLSYDYNHKSPEWWMSNICDVYAHYPDLEIADCILRGFARQLKSIDDSRDIDLYWSKSYVINIVNTFLEGIDDIGAPRNEVLIRMLSDDVVWHILKCLGSSHYGTIIRILSKLMQYVPRANVKKYVLQLAESGDSGLVVPFAMCDPDGPDSFDLAKNQFKSFMTRARISIIQSDKDGYYNYCAPGDTILSAFHSLYLWPELLDLVAWNDITSYKVMSDVFRLIASDNASAITFSTDGIETILKRVCGEISQHAEMIASDESSHPLLAYIARLANKYGITDDTINSTYRIMCDAMFATGHAGDGIRGICSRFEIPYEEWDKYYKAYGREFIDEYIMRIPVQVWQERDYIGDYVIDKVKNVTPSERYSILTDGCRTTRGGSGLKSVIAKRLSAAIINGEITPTPREFRMYVTYRFVDAAAMRYMTEKQESESGVQIKSNDDVENVIDTFSRLMKLDSLPAIVKRTYDYLMQGIYKNLGDGSHTWKIDEQGSFYVTNLSALTGMICRKAKTGTVPKVIKELFDSGIVDKLSRFREENIAACANPNQPAAKFKCIAERVIDIAVESLRNALPTAEAALEKKPRSKKSA
jgi:hypothetical protein